MQCEDTTRSDSYSRAGSLILSDTLRRFESDESSLLADCCNCDSSDRWWRWGMCEGTQVSIVSTLPAAYLWFVSLQKEDCSTVHAFPEMLVTARRSEEPLRAEKSVKVDISQTLLHGRDMLCTRINFAIVCESGRAKGISFLPSCCHIRRLLFQRQRDPNVHPQTSPDCFRRCHHHCHHHRLRQRQRRSTIGCCCASQRCWSFRCWSRMRR